MFTLIFIKLEVQSLYFYDSMSFHKNHCMSDIYSFFFFSKGVGGLLSGYFIDICSSYFLL